MFGHLFRRRDEKKDAIVTALYSRIVAAARQPEFYSEWGAPDTPLGRFELIALHMVLALRRMSGSAPTLRGLAQELTDMFFMEVDHSLRELGVGDMGVPKRMKRLAKMFYGRAESYTQAIDRGDAAGLAAALGRNIWPGGAGEGDAAKLARYALAATAALADQPDANLAAGKVVFPAADGINAA